MTKHKRATRYGDISNHIAEHHFQTNHVQNRLGLLNALPTVRTIIIQLHSVEYK